MLRAKFRHPELDVLDSPLISPNPFTPSSVQFVPGSALAEKIFNDPDSWEETEGDEGDLPEDVDEADPLSWLVEEVEKFKATTSSEGTEPDVPPSEVKDKPTLLLPESPRETIVSIKGIARRGSVRPISLAALFERPGDEFSKEIQSQLSKILDSGGIPHQIRALPSSANTTATPSSGTPSTADTAYMSSALNTPYPPLSAASLAPSEGDASPAIHSASATLSFLEWYGIYPDSPSREVTRKLSLAKRKMSTHPKARKAPPSPAPSRPPSYLNSTAHTPVATTPLKQVATRSGALEVPPLPQPQETRPSTPPGLTRPQGARISPKSSSNTLNLSTPPTRKPSVPPADTVPETSTPPRRTPSPPKEPLPRPPTADANSPLPMLLRKPSVDHTNSPIRRLPSLPGTSRSSTPPSQTLTYTPARTDSPLPTPLPPLPSSLPTSLPTGSSLMYGGSHSPCLTPSTFSLSAMSPQQPPHSGRALSVRSPLGGPVGPRTRASTRTSQDTTFGSRITSAISNRPPGLRL